MSRTFRRKNYELENQGSYRNGGRKLAGYYTQRGYEGAYGEDGKWFSYYVYSEPTKAEFFEEYWNVHGDNHDYHSKPGKWYRYFTIHQYRMQDKTELRKYMKNDDYEPMCRDRISSGYWD